MPPRAPRIDIAFAPALLFCLSLALAMSAAPRPASAFTIQFSNLDFGAAGVVPSFSIVRDFRFEIDFQGPLTAGRAYDNDSLVQVQYVVSGSLDVTPSGFPGFSLDRTPAREGPISASEWIGQGSSLSFEIASSANLLDGLQLSDLVPDANGLLLALDGREFERLDRARYHPPQLLLYANGTGLIQNSNNSSGSTNTTNPGSTMLVDVDFGEEYLTNLNFDPSSITLVVPQPGTAILMGLGLMVLASKRALPTALRVGATRER